MEFLKAILGDDLYSQVVEKVNAHNGDEANRDKIVKIGNLGSGEYVGKGKFDSEIEKLNAIISGRDNELATANKLIADLQKATKGNEEMQSKFADYQTQVAKLQEQLAETKVKAALKVALLSAKVDDIDYVTFKINEKLKAEGKTLELDENENIKGWDDILSGVKVQLPAHFAKSNSIQVEANPLPEQNPNRTGLTKEEFAKMGYQSRLKLKQEQPDVYAQMAGKLN